MREGLTSHGSATSWRSPATITPTDGPARVDISSNRKRPDRRHGKTTATLRLCPNVSITLMLNSSAALRSSVPLSKIAVSGRSVSCSLPSSAAHWFEP
jgi:hypothetical protein